MTPAEQDKMSDEKLTKAIYEAMQVPYLSERHDAIMELITAYTNKQIEAVLDRLELSMRGKTIVDTAEGWQKFVKRHVVAYVEAERNKLKEEL